MSLRQQLEEKQRRRLVVPIRVSDPGDDQAAAETLQAALSVAVAAEDEGTAEGLRQQMLEVADRIRSHWAWVELEAMPRDQWRAVTSVWQTVENTEDGPQVVTDWAEALAPLLAESCTDPELKDADWWAAQLERPEWSEGDTNALRRALLQLNVDAVNPQVPKD